MNKATKLLWILLSFVFITSSVSAWHNTHSSWYNAAIVDWSIKFEAKLDWSKVYTSWTAYNKAEKFKYYKVVRSDSVSNPVYPDHGYIKYEWDVNKTQFIDYNPLVWKSYYRVCAITYENNRYCSNVVKIYNENENPVVCTMEWAPVCWKKDEVYKTYSNKCMLNWDGAIYKYNWECNKNNVVWWDKDKHGCIASAWYTWCEAKQKCLRSWEEKCVEILSYKLRMKADKLVQSFVSKIESKYESNDDRIDVLNDVISKLEKLSKTKNKLSALIDYLVLKLKEKVDSYDYGFSEIEKIFNEY